MKEGPVDVQDDDDGFGEFGEFDYAPQPEKQDVEEDKEKEQAFGDFEDPFT